jgi:hypothetical protein
VVISPLPHQVEIDELLIVDSGDSLRRARRKAFIPGVNNAPHVVSYRSQWKRYRVRRNMKRRIIAAVALMAAIATSAQAESYIYICRVPSAHKSYPVKLDIDNATLIWRGTTFRNLRQVGGAEPNIRPPAMA